jgi:hypothetical protein
MGNVKDLNDIISKKYDHEFWGLLNSSLQPLALAFFVVDHIRDAEEIAKEFRSLEMVDNLHNSPIP